MNTNKKNKNKKVNEAISNIGKSTSFQNLSDVENNLRKDKKNSPQGLK